MIWVESLDLRVEAEEADKARTDERTVAYATACSPSEVRYPKCAFGPWKPFLITFALSLFYQISGLVVRKVNNMNHKLHREQ